MGAFSLIVVINLLNRCACSPFKDDIEGYIDASTGGTKSAAAAKATNGRPAHLPTASPESGAGSARTVEEEHHSHTRETLHARVPHDLHHGSLLGLHSHDRPQLGGAPLQRPPRGMGGKSHSGGTWTVQG